MHHLAVSITDLGDSAVTLPMAAVTIAILFVARRARMALWWGGSIVAAAGVLAGLKLALTAAAPHHSLTGLTSPSGHAGMSAIVFGGFVLLLGPSLTRGRRRSAQIAGAILVMAIAVSRIVLREHSITETVVGLCVGIAALAGLRAGLVRAAPERVPAAALSLAALAVVGLMHGTRWRTEPMIRALARSDLVHELDPWHG
jgi:undecaprenyl-diphosphatase